MDLFLLLNPEPWRAPSLGIKKVGKRSVPVSFKDENLRAYQEAVKELVEEALAEQGIPTPVFPKDALLQAEFSFWRQLDRYKVGAERTRVRQQPDVTNMVKAVEDALQGLIYHNDRSIRRSLCQLVDVGPDVEAGVLIRVEPLNERQLTLPVASRDWLRDNGVCANSKIVWTQRGTWG